MAWGGGSFRGEEVEEGSENESNSAVADFQSFWQRLIPTPQSHFLLSVKTFTENSSREEGGAPFLF